MPRILVIEDDREIQDLLREVLGDAGYELLVVDTLDRGAAGAAPDLVISDLVGLNGYHAGRARAAVQRIQQQYPGTPIIVCSAHEQALKEPDRLGAAAVLHKPFSIEELSLTVARLTRR